MGLDPSHVFIHTNCVKVPRLWAGAGRLTLAPRRILTGMSLGPMPPTHPRHRSASLAAALVVACLAAVVPGLVAGAGERQPAAGASVVPTAAPPQQGVPARVNARPLREPLPLTPATASPTTTVTAVPLVFSQDALVDPVVTGVVSGPGGAAVAAQVLVDGAWTTQATASSDAVGAYSITLAFGHGELRTDTWRIVSGASSSPDIRVERLAVLNPVVHTPTRQEVSSSWREGCPMPYTSLRVMAVNYYGFDQRMHRGSVVVRDTAVVAFQGLLQVMIDSRFPIRTMQPVEAYGASDAKSAADDNTSAFNCRLTTLGGAWSEHSYGWAFDINPVENPYFNGGVMVPPAGKPYLDRGTVRPGMLTPDSPVITYALAHSWTWLTPTDYQHLEWAGSNG